jgi:putative flippase GtrA
MKIVLKQAIRYLAASALAFCLDFTLLFVLVHYFFWWYLAAATTSFLAGLLVAYALSITLVFDYRRMDRPHVEFATFAAIGAVGVAINAAVIAVGVKYLGVHYLIAKCGAAGVTFTWNFLARRQMLFVRPLRFKHSSI